MKQTINFILSASVIIGISTSCNKAVPLNSIPANADIPTILQYMNVMTKKTDITFGITSQTMMNKTNQNLQIYCISGNAIDYGGSKPLPINVGTLQFGNFICTPAPNNHYGLNDVKQDFLGKTISIKTDNRVATSATSIASRPDASADAYALDDSLYIPQPMVILNSINTEGVFGPYYISVGNNFKWNTDSKNIGRGIVVIAEYEPFFEESAGVKQVYSTQIVNGLVVPDNGSYSLEESLFKGMPKGGGVRISFIRGNYKVGETVGGKDYLLYAASEKSYTYTYK